MAIKCKWCGKFLSYENATHVFIPDNEYGPEENYWECEGQCETIPKKGELVIS